MEMEPYRPGLSRNQGLVQQLREFQRNPRSLVFVSLAETYRQEGLPQQALEILQEGMVYHPGLASAVVCRARCLFDLKRYAEALADLQVALLHNPENLKAYKLQSEIYLRLGQRKAAMRSLTKVLALYPQDHEASRALSELELLLAPPKAPVPVRTAAPPPSLGRIEDFQVGTFTQSMHQIEEAESSLAPSGELPKAQPLAAQVAPDWTEEDEASAVASSSAIRAEPENATDEEPAFATRTIAELYLRQGLKGKAVKVLRKLLRDDPTNAWARETLQDLSSDGILLPSPKAEAKRSDSLAKRARVLEQLLAQVRMMKQMGA